MSNENTTVKELKARAAELGIPGRSTMKKAELEAAIAEALLPPRMWSTTPGKGRNEPPPVEYMFSGLVELGPAAYKRVAEKEA